MWVFAVLLGIAGVRKLVAPDATGAALQGARLPSDLRLVRLLGAGEILLATGVVLLGGRWTALLLAVAYAGFAAFADHQRRRGAGCGCFGQSDAPATRLHVGVDAAGAGVAVLAAWRPGPSLLTTLTGGVVEAALTLVLLGVATIALQLALTALPELAAAAALDSSERAAA